MTAATQLLAQEVSAIVTTSFLHAIGGESQLMSETFLIQQVPGTNAIIASCQKKSSHLSTDIGILTEQICFPLQQEHASSYVISQIQVGNFKLMVTSEVDGYDTATQRPVEIKAKKKARVSMKDFMQVMVNGSSKICIFKPSNDAKVLETLTEHSLVEGAEFMEGRKNEATWLYKGQRIKHILDIILNHPMVQNATDRPVALNFDYQKLPIFSPGPQDSSLVPLGFKIPMSSCFNSEKI